MSNQSAWLKTLAVVGTVVLGLVLLLPLALALVALASGRGFLFDYLLPGELGLVVIVAGALLLAAAFWARACRGLIGWGLAGGFLSLGLGLWLAQVTGLATSPEPVGGWRLWLVQAMLAGYWAGLIVALAGGVLLVRRLFAGGALSHA